MIKIKQPVIIISLMLFFSTCSVQKDIPTETELKAKFGNNNFSWNSDSTFLLVVKKTGSISNKYLTPLDFLIYSLNSGSVTYKQFLPGGTINWIDNYILRIEILPGNITGEETEKDFTYFYDVKINKKTTNIPGD